MRGVGLSGRVPHPGQLVPACSRSSARGTGSRETSTSSGSPGDIALMTIYRKLPADLSELGGPSNGFVLEGSSRSSRSRPAACCSSGTASPEVGLSESLLPVPEDEGTSKLPWDYFHINSADVDSDGNILISARHTSAVYKLSKRTGKIIWRLGGRRATSPSARARSSPGNTTCTGGRTERSRSSTTPRSGPTKGVQSRALRLRVDTPHPSRHARPRLPAPAAAPVAEPGQRAVPGQRQRLRRLGPERVLHRVLGRGQGARGREVRQCGAQHRLLPRLPLPLGRDPDDGSLTRF